VSIENLSLEERVARLEAVAHPPVDLRAAMYEVATDVAASRNHEHSMIKAWFVAVLEPGKIPEKKRPWVNSLDGVLTLLRELIACRREGVRLIVCQVTTDDDLWLEDGHEMVAIDDAMRPKRRRRKAA